MPNQEVLIRFRGDPAQLQAAIKQMTAAHGVGVAQVLAQTKQANRAIEQEERRLAATMIREARAAYNSRTQAARAAVADIRRMEREREQIMAQNARAIAAIARGEADARIREGRRAANAALATLKSPAGGGGSDFASVLGFGGGIAGGVTALVGASVISQIRAGAAAWVHYASKLETTKIAFTTMLGSEQLALVHLKELQAFALRTPFQFEELIDASQRMQALGFEAEQIVPILTDVGNAVAAAGGGSERLDRVTLALSQMQSKGKVMTQELNQLAEAGIPAWRIMEQQLGRSRAELVKMVEQGQISSTVFLEAFQKFSQQNFGGLMEKQSKTFVGALSNIKDSALALSTNAMAPLFKILTDTTFQVGKFTTGLNEASQGAGRLIGLLTQMPGLLDAIRLVPAITGLPEVFRALSLLGTPEITPLNVGKAGQPVPLQSSEANAQAEQISALRAASEEAKRIATDRIANQERAFKLGQITRREETVSIIVELQKRAEAEKKALEDELDRKLQELNANRDNAEKQASIIETIGNLQQQIKNNESTVAREIADKRAAFQIQERSNLLEHERAKLDILLAAGQARIQLIESQIRAGITTAEDGAAQIEAIENAGFKARNAQLENELANAGKEPSERQKIKDAIAKLEVEQTANTQRQADRRVEITKQANANDLSLNRQLISIREVQREGELQRIDDLLERQGISESTAITHRLGILQEEHQDRLALINIEIGLETTTALRKIELDNDKIRSEQKFTDEKKRLTNERIDALSQEAVAADAERERERSRGITDAEKFGDPGAIGKKIEQQLGSPPSGQGNASAIDQLFGAINTHLGGNQQAAALAGLQAMTGAFGELGQALGTAAAAWVLYGNAGTSIRKMTAEVLASITRQAVIKSIWEFAEGLAALALAFFGMPNAGPSAAMHFAASAMYAGIAGGSALIGRKVAGDTFNQTTASGSGSGSSSSGSSTPKTQEVDRRQGSSIQTITNEITFRVKGDVVVDEFVKDYELNGRTRIKIISDGQG